MDATESRDLAAMGVVLTAHTDCRDAWQRVRAARQAEANTAPRQLVTPLNSWECVHRQNFSFDNLNGSLVDRSATYHGHVIDAVVLGGRDRRGGVGVRADVAVEVVCEHTLASAGSDVCIRFWEREAAS